MKSNIFSAVLASLLLVTSVAGCAQKSEKIRATYVSPTTYSRYSCSQITSERNRVVNKVNEMSGQQDEKAGNDAVAMGVGLVLFWPALFFLAAGSDLEPQLAALKGTHDALTAAGTEKGCF